MSEPTSANPAREAEAKLYHERQARRKKVQEAPPKAVETWYELTGSAMNKVVRKTKTERGNVHSVYVGTRKQCDANGIQYRK